MATLPLTHVQHSLTVSSADLMVKEVLVVDLINGTMETGEEAEEEETCAA